MIVYLSGKITGDPGYRAKFKMAAWGIREQGHTVLNPACLPEGLQYEDYMRIDMEMLRAAEAIVMLPDWKDSPGAKREFIQAARWGKKIFRYPFQA